MSAGPGWTGVANKRRQRSRQQLLKRQREWVYLQHFLTVSGVAYDQIIDGQDDGHEPDFSLVYQDRIIGLELTTLPDLRDQLGERRLRLMRWYWRWLAPLDRHNRLLRRLLHWSGHGTSHPDYLHRQIQQAQQPASPSDSLSPLGSMSIASIAQAIRKKIPKIPGYQRRRPLDQLWLLIHTDQQQSQGQLQWPDTSASLPVSLAASGFNRIYLTCYPDRQLMELTGTAYLADTATPSNKLPK